MKGDRCWRTLAPVTFEEGSIAVGEGHSGIALPEPLLVNEMAAGATERCVCRS